MKNRSSPPLDRFFSFPVSHMSFPVAHVPIAILHCSGYAEEVLDPALARCLAAIATETSLSGGTVLLKPNLISGRGPALACTHAAFLLSTARYFLDRGARVAVGDSPAFGSAREVLAKHGMLAPLERLQVKVVNFRTPVEFRLDNGVKVEIAAEALDCDLFVNLPKFKAHNQMYVTGAVKNFFGTIVGMRKAMMHMRNGGSHEEFSEILIRLPDLFPNHMSVMDAVEVMHRSGPLDGDPLQLGCVAASSCPVSLDTAMLALVGLPLKHSPLWRTASAMHAAGSSPDNHHYPLEQPHGFAAARFHPPGMLNPIRFTPFRFMVSGLRRFALAFRS